ncbi:hypothetical protein SAMN05421747_10415 [Parapedobacter composti]|uniref:Uncharacterized protein n=1 Tax=Parapedobacter composti TaxID=623281 RepID=A0A1I1GC35_9SPHI|nr:hypothetical protein [Parapedobacter composti]SFC07428.1 hypothetical protein SAMN05421747_10415 [Parapedobacter composti]
MNNSKAPKRLDAWKTEQYFFTKNRGDIDYIIATRLADNSVFIVENDVIRGFLASDAGLDAALQDERAFGHFPVLRLSESELNEEYSRVHFCGKYRRIEFNYTGVEYFNEAEATLNRNNSETSSAYQLNCFAALVFAGFKGYEKRYNMPSDLTVKQVVAEIGFVNKPAIEKIQGIFRDTIQNDPDLAECYGFQSF